MQVKTDPNNARQSHIKSIIFTLLKKLVSPITRWGNLLEFKYLCADTAAFTLVLIKPFEEMKLSEIKSVIMMYKVAHSIDIINRLDKETVMHTSPMNVTESLTNHDYVPTIRGESKKFEKAIIELLEDEEAVENLRTQPLAVELYECASADIRHKYFKKYAPVMINLVESSGGKIVWNVNRNNQAAVDFQITMPDSCIRNLLALMFYRTPTRVALQDHVALLNEVLPAENSSANNSWRQSQTPGYCYERVVTRAEHLSFFNELAELRLNLGLSFLEINRAKTKIDPEYKEYAIVQIELATPNQIYVLFHLSPRKIIAAVNDLLDTAKTKYQLRVTGPLSFKLMLEQTEVSILSEKINTLAAEYQLKVTKNGEEFLFKSLNLIPKVVSAQNDSVAVNSSPIAKNECNLNLRDKQQMVVNILNNNPQLSKPAQLGKLLFPLKISCKNEEQLADFKMKLEGFIQSNYTQDLTPKRIQEIADDIILAQNKSVDLIEALDDGSLSLSCGIGM